MYMYIPKLRKADINSKGIRVGSEAKIFQGKYEAIKPESSGWLGLEGGG